MRALTCCDAVGGDGRHRTEILRGFVGDKVAKQFWSFFSEQKLPDVVKLKSMPAADVQRELRKLQGSQLLVTAHATVLDSLRFKETDQYVEQWEQAQKVLVCFSDVGYEEIAQLVYNSLFCVRLNGEDIINLPEHRPDGSPFKHEYTVLDRNRAETGMYMASLKGGQK